MLKCQLTTEKDQKQYNEKRIYLMKSNKCFKTYISRTKRLVHARVREHLKEAEETTPKIIRGETYNRRRAWNGPGGNTERGQASKTWPLLKFFHRLRNSGNPSEHRARKRAFPTLQINSKIELGINGTSLFLLS